MKIGKQICNYPFPIDLPPNGIPIWYHMALRSQSYSIQFEMNLKYIFMSLENMPTVHTGEKLHWLSERLAFLGIMGDQLRAPHKPLNTIVLWWFQGALN